MRNTHLAWWLQADNRFINVMSRTSRLHDVCINRFLILLTLSQCTLAGPMYIGMPMVDPVYTGIPLEKLSWNSPTLECHLRNLVESAPHWDAIGETLTFAAYTGTPLHGWVTVTTNRSYHQPRWRRPKTVRPNNRGYQENLTARCAHMTLTCRCHITLCISAMTICFSSAGSENLHLEFFRKLVVTVRPCWS